MAVSCPIRVLLRQRPVTKPTSEIRQSGGGAPQPFFPAILGLHGIVSVCGAGHSGSQSLLRHINQIGRATMVGSILGEYNHELM
jgi:hypothetical protein